MKNPSTIKARPIAITQKLLDVASGKGRNPIFGGATVTIDANVAFEPDGKPWRGIQTKIEVIFYWGDICGEHRGYGNAWFNTAADAVRYLETGNPANAYITLGEAQVHAENARRQAEEALFADKSDAEPLTA